MQASVEKPDGTYEIREMGDPVCGEDFCDGCGDCLDCQSHGEDQEYCSGVSRWVIYIDNPKNPYYNEVENRRRADALEMAKAELAKQWESLKKPL